MHINWLQTASWTLRSTQERPRAFLETPERASRVTPRGPEGAFESHRDAPRATKEPQTVPRAGRRAHQSALRRAKMELKDVAEARKVKSIQSAPRLAPADARSTLDRSKSALKQPESYQIDQFARASQTLHRVWVCKSTSVSTCKPVCTCWTGLHVHGGRA